MTTSSGLLALAERCEQATGPDRVLDFWIATRLDPTANDTDAAYQADIDSLGIEGMWIPHAYTASLDAAIRLVPAGWVWSINTFPKKASAYLMNEGDQIVRPASQYQATPTLALCAAALRARTALNPR